MTTTTTMNVPFGATLREDDKICREREGRARQAQTIARLLEALADPTRLEILRLLHREPQCSLAVEELVDLVGGKEQPTISHHLRRLLKVGLVRCALKKGQWRYYVTEQAAVVAACMAPLDYIGLAQTT